MRGFWELWWACRYQDLLHSFVKIKIKKWTVKFKSYSILKMSGIDGSFILYNNTQHHKFMTENTLIFFYGINCIDFIGCCTPEHSVTTIKWEVFMFNYLHWICWLLEKGVGAQYKHNQNSQLWLVYYIDFGWITFFQANVQLQAFNLRWKKYPRGDI